MARARLPGDEETPMKAQYPCLFFDGNCRTASFGPYWMLSFERTQAG